MTKYYEEEKSAVIFPPNNLANVLADTIETAGLRQYHTAETEKYAHVTYFFNGGSHRVHNMERQIVVPSPKVKTYDLMPEMSAPAVADKVVEAINSQHDFVVVNFANGDMVGHTGNLAATVKACEAVDQVIGKVLAVASVLGYQVFITADHGNCEVMVNPLTGEPYTEHTTSPVPFCGLNLAVKPFSLNLPETFSKDDLLKYSADQPECVLADIAPTVIASLGLLKPREMSGESLLQDLQM
jgi:2,3-bisphosphoglycerate-independent phosphoglycerate mutase